MLLCSDWERLVGQSSWQVSRFYFIFQALNNIGFFVFISRCDGANDEWIKSAMSSVKYKWSDGIEFESDASLVRSAEKRVKMKIKGIKYDDWHNGSVRQDPFRGIGVADGQRLRRWVAFK